jgi:hypothetical protein
LLAWRIPILSLSVLYCKGQWVPAILIMPRFLPNMSLQSTTHSKINYTIICILLLPHHCVKMGMVAALLNLHGSASVFMAMQHCESWICPFLLFLLLYAFFYLLFATTSHIIYNEFKHRKVLSMKIFVFLLHNVFAVFFGKVLSPSPQNSRRQHRN